MEWDYNYVVAIDYDGTLVCDKERTTIQEDVLRFAKNVKQLGCIIILWTSRCGTELQEAIDTCASRGLYFDYINEYPKRTTSPKVCADLYVDNKCVPGEKIPVKAFYRQIRRELATGRYTLVRR